jgi:hypothetical protein
MTTSSPRRAFARLVEGRSGAPAPPEFSTTSVDARRRADQGKPERLDDLGWFRISDGVGLPHHIRYRDIFCVNVGGSFRARNDLSALADDLTSLLAGVGRLGAKIGALFTRGFSREIRESIAPDARNQLELRDWECLIEALVQSFEAACNERRDLAICVAQRWRMLWLIDDQALFGRLYIHAAIRLRELSVDEAVQTCLARPDVLWKYEYEPEFLALLRVRGSEISHRWLGALIEQLLMEPPGDEFEHRQ